jgi:hypothetical protein
MSTSRNSEMVQINCFGTWVKEAECGKYWLPCNVEVSVS